MNSARKIICNRRNLQSWWGVRRETIGNLENGKYNPSLKLAMDIAKVFERTIVRIWQNRE